MSQYIRRLTHPPEGLTVRTYRLAGRTVDRIDRLAEELGVTQSDLVGYLLENTLEQVEKGTLKPPLVRREIATIQHRY